MLNKPARFFVTVMFLCATAFYPGCSPRSPQATAGTETVAVSAKKEDARLRRALERAELPESVKQSIMSDEAGFLAELATATNGDPYLYILTDKQHPLEPLNYKPDDLTELVGTSSYSVSRAGMFLREPAVVSLEQMSRDAGQEGVTLTASSAFRSYDYQVEVYNRNVRENGRETADRESARPGYSQHQLGLVIDFGSINDEFAKTKAGKWLLANAWKYGWSLSFPDGYESITGYRWECWHYRYLGRPLAVLTEKRFNGIQQYALRFIHEWLHYETNS